MYENKTKIIATISDLKCDIQLIKDLYDNGMNVARLNTAHQSLQGTLKVIENIRKVSDKIGILIDTKGPEVRTAGIEDKISVSKGDILTVANLNSSNGNFQVNYDSFTEDVPVNSTILIDDGLVKFTVIGKTEKGLEIKAENSGFVGNRKTVNTPDVKLKLQAVSAKDIEYINFAAENNLDFIAHSFVRSREDILKVQEILDSRGSSIKIIAKIENKEGIDNLEEILDTAYGIMIARGDLGIEIPAEQVPGLQKMIIDRCIKKAKPVITATQMLHTMIDNPRPTRAEVSDVAAAIYDGTDAVMLSGETAYGKYPVEAIKTMTNIIKTIEKETPPFRELPVFDSEKRIRNYLIKSAVEATSELDVKAIIVDTASGLSARLISSYRCKKVIFAKIHDRAAVRQLTLSYGVHCSYMEMPLTTGKLIKGAVGSLVDQNLISPEDNIILLASTPGNPAVGANILEINKARLCLEGREGRNLPGGSFTV